MEVIIEVLLEDQIFMSDWRTIPGKENFQKCIEKYPKIGEIELIDYKKTCNARLASRKYRERATNMELTEMRSIKRLEQMRSELEIDKYELVREIYWYQNILRYSACM